MGLTRVASFASLLLGAVFAQEQIVLTGVVRDFAELVPKTQGGHPDFNPTEKPDGTVDYGCFDRPDAARGAVQEAIGTHPVNPDGVAGLLPFDGDDRGPVLKPGYDAPPNCFRSRFADWFTTRSPDVNRAFFLDLAFRKNGSVYEYNNPEFFPLDNPKLGALRPMVPSVTATFGHRQSGMLDGVDLASRNYGFTFELHAKFTYKRGTGQRFHFLGDDDVWVYINGRLVIDLGGLHSAENAEVNLDNLGLVDGHTYPLDFFFAERRVVASRLTITTSLELRPPDDPDPPVIPPPVKVLEGIYFDRNGDGIADSAEIVLDSMPVKAPSLLELRLGGEVERGNWDILPLGGARFAIRSKGANFFTRPVTAWDEADPANQGRTLKDASAGLSDAAFPMKDGIGPVIAKAVKTVVDTTLSEAPTAVVTVTFSEPVTAGSAGALKFKDKSGIEQRVDMSRLEPVDAAGGATTTWNFILSPATPNDPAEGWQVAVGEPAQVRDGRGITAHPENPWRPIESRLPDIHIGRLRAEKVVTVTPLPPETPVSRPFVILTSDKVTPTYKDYVPLRPGEAEEWIRRLDGGANPGVVVFNLEISHPAQLELSIFDHLGQFVNKTKATITREDLLQSGLFSRVPSTRAFLVRLAWYPQAHDGRHISTGAYILKARYNYGIDARDHVAKGTRDQFLTFGFVRPADVKGMD